MAKAIRDVYGEALVKYGKDNKDVVVLDADVSGSTKSATFGKACPDRFFNMGIAEANMTAVAAGMASVGKIPFVNTFAVFLTSIGLITACASIRLATIYSTRSRPLRPGMQMSVSTRSKGMRESSRQAVSASSASYTSPGRSPNISVTCLISALRA